MKNRYYYWKPLMSEADLEKFCWIEWDELGYSVESVGEDEIWAACFVVQDLYKTNRDSARAIIKSKLVADDDYALDWYLYDNGGSASEAILSGEYKNYK